MITGKVIKILPKSLRAKVENNYELRAIMGNVNWLTFENILRNIIGMFIFGWIARYLGPENFGLMSYSVAFVTLFLAFSTLGLDDIVVRNLISYPEKQKEYLGSTLFMKFIGSLFMMLFSVVGIILVEKSDASLTFFVFILAFGYVFKSFDAIDFWFRSQVKSQYSVYARSISFIIVSAIKIALIVTQAPLVAFVAMYSLDFILSAVFLVFFYRRESERSIFKWKINKSVLKELILDCWPLFLGGITSTVQSEIDQVLLKNMIGAEELGIYSAGIKIIAAFAFVSAVLKSSFLPSIISAKKTSERLYKKKLEQFSQLMMIVFLGVSIPLILFKDFIVQILYGNEFIGVVSLIPLFCIRIFFIYFGAARSNFLLGENYMKYSFLTTLLGAVVNIILNIYLIPQYQAIGAIIAFTVSYFITYFVIDLIYPKTRANAILMIKSMFNFYRIFFPKNE
jgi:PST family polysaccharide transporter